MYITNEKRTAAEKVLIDNGIDRDEAATVLQALGYVLLDTELYDERVHEEYIDVFPQVDAEDLFFMTVPCKEKDHEKLYAAVAKLLSKLDTWYGDTDQDTDEWAVEFALWSRMLLLPLSNEENSPTLGVMLNPEKLDISDPEQEDCLLGFIAAVGGNERAATYKTLRGRIQDIKKAWCEETGDELFFLYRLNSDVEDGTEAQDDSEAPQEAPAAQMSTFEAETPVGTIIVEKFGSDATPGIAIDFKRKGDTVADPVAIINYDDCSVPGADHNKPEMDMRICLWQNNSESYTNSIRLSHLSKPYTSED